MKIEIGSIIRIPLQNDRFGIARIISIVDDTCLFELFISKVFNSKEQIDTSIILANKKVYIWGYNTNIKNKKWKIIDNIIPEKNFEMPYFIDSSFYLEEPIHRLYLQKGDIFNPLCGVGKKIYISEDRAKELFKTGILNAGIAFPKAIISVFINQLRFNNIDID